MAVQRNLLAAPQGARICPHRQPAAVVVTAERASASPAELREEGGILLVNHVNLVNDPVVIIRLMAESCFQPLAVASTMAREVV